MVQNWGTGRKDYSENVETSVVPVARSYQVNATSSTSFLLGNNQTLSVAIPMTFSTGALSHFIFNMDVSADANVLIGMIIVSGGITFVSEQGMQKINVPIPQGLDLSSITLQATNYSAGTITYTYSHNGIQGSSKIMAQTSL